MKKEFTSHLMSRLQVEHRMYGGRIQHRAGREFQPAWVMRGLTWYKAKHITILDLFNVVAPCYVVHIKNVQRDAK